MFDRMSVRSNGGQDTQLETIRDLMLTAARRGAWLTLGEIAELTEIGEASVSAQLRHLRKRRYGLHLVEKRQRLPRPIATGPARDARSCKKKGVVAEPVMWEYRVLPSAVCGTFADSVEGIGEVAWCSQREAEGVRDAEARD